MSGYASYSINVSENGKFLFRTEEQPGLITDPDVQHVVEAIALRFPKAEGFQVQLIQWPTHAGTMSDVTK